MRTKKKVVKNKTEVEEIVQVNTATYNGEVYFHAVARSGKCYMSKMDLRTGKHGDWKLLLNPVITSPRRY